jgi:hypothetical protein
MAFRMTKSIRTSSAARLMPLKGGAMFVGLKSPGRTILEPGISAAIAIVIWPAAQRRIHRGQPTCRRAGHGQDGQIMEQILGHVVGSKVGRPMIGHCG